MRSGIQRDVVESLIEETGADMVLWNRRYGIGAVERAWDRRGRYMGCGTVVWDGQSLQVVLKKDKDQRRSPVANLIDGGRPEATPKVRWHL